MRDESDEPIQTYNIKYMRLFLRESKKGRRVCSFNQYYKSKICADVLKILSRELKVEGNVYKEIEAYMKFKNNHLKFIKEDYEKIAMIIDKETNKN